MKDSTYGLELLDEEEIRVARFLLEKGKISPDQLIRFIDMRRKYSNDGKKYLGEILVQRGFVSKDDIGQFFLENNRLYLKFCEEMVQTGFMSRRDYEALTESEGSKESVVEALEKLNIMTRATFTRLFASRVNALRLGEWLKVTGKIADEKLRQALLEQSIFSFADYLEHENILSKEEQTALLETQDNK